MSKVPAAALLGALVLAPAEARAWIESEHVEITAAAVAGFARPEADPASRKTLEAFWAAARGSSAAMAKALCPTPLPAFPNGCIGVAELPMLAADHACSPGELLRMLENVAARSSASPNGLALVRVAFEAREKLDRVSAQARPRLAAKAESEADILADLRAQRLRIRRDLDFELEVADHDYLGRASGATHFTRQVRGVNSALHLFLTRSLQPSTPLNATAGFAGYHALALRYALGFRALPANKELALWALLSEAFALHFLEDSFSVGHSVSATANSVERMGTHDHYSEYGLDARLWRGGFYKAHGDAYLAQEDKRVATAALDVALDQLAFALAGAGHHPLSAEDLALLAKRRIPAGLSTCPAPGRSADTLVVTPAFDGLADAHFVDEVIELTPRPTTEDPGVPHFHAEEGWFIPFGASVSGAALGYGHGGFSSSLGARLAVAGIGFASDAALSDMKDGFFSASPLASFETESFSTVNFGFGFRIRAPWVAYFPGDALIWGPALGAQFCGSTTSIGSSGLGQALRGNFWYPSPSIRLQYELGREFEFVFSFRQEVSVDGGRSVTHFTRWDATLPIASLRFVHAFSDAYANDVLLRAAFRIGHEESTIARSAVDGAPVSGTFLGPTLTLTQMARAYTRGSGDVAPPVAEP